MMQMISPIVKPVVIQGRLSYIESLRAFGTIRLTRKVIDLFPQLAFDKKWHYQLEYQINKETAIKRIQESNALPILLFLYSEENHG